jgi:hypothetical protein
VTTLNGRVEINANRRGGARVEEGSRLTVNGDTLISLNTSPRPGGGIANLDGEVFLNDDSDVLRNTAPIGGGIFNSDGGLMELNDTTRIARNGCDRRTRRRRLQRWRHSENRKLYPHNRQHSGQLLPEHYLLDRLT